MVTIDSIHEKIFWVLCSPFFLSCALSCLGRGGLLPSFLPLVTDKMHTSFVCLFAVAGCRRKGEIRECFLLHSLKLSLTSKETNSWGYCVHIQNVWFCPVALPALAPLLLLLLALTCGSKRRNQKKKTQATKQQQLQTVLYQQRRRRTMMMLLLICFFVCNGRH